MLESVCDWFVSLEISMLSFFPYLNNFRDTLLNQDWYFKIIFIIVILIIIPMTWGLYDEIKTTILEIYKEKKTLTKLCKKCNKKIFITNKQLKSQDFRCKECIVNDAFEGMSL